MTKLKRALVTFPDHVWDILQNDMKGKIGDSDSQVIRHIVTSYLSEKGYFVAKDVKDPSQDLERLKEYMNEIVKPSNMKLSNLIKHHNLLTHKVTAVVQLLSEKNLLRDSEVYTRTGEIAEKWKVKH